MRPYNSVTKAGRSLVALEGVLSSKLHQVALVKKIILSCKLLIVHVMIWLSFAMPSLLVVDIFVVANFVVCLRFQNVVWYGEVL